MSITLGYVISGHGFGHATRAIAVMQALEQLLSLRFVILTSAPPWLFNNSLSADHVVHPLETDVGLVQHSALSEDLAASLVALRRFYPLRGEHMQKAATLLKDCALIVSDISPLGLEVARHLQIPSVLVENFTWDWIYAPFEPATPALAELSQHIGELFLKADYRIQAQPVCAPTTCDLVVAPVARQLLAPKQIRQYLRCTPQQQLVLITMGGIGGQKKEDMQLEILRKRDDTVFVLTGLSPKEEFQGNLRFLGQESDCYFPDLIASADLVVGKTGYSTVAEAYQGGTAYGYIRRPNFREAQILEAFLDSHLDSWEIEERALYTGAWLECLDRLEKRERTGALPENGANQIALFLHALLQDTTV